MTVPSSSSAAAVAVCVAAAICALLLNTWPAASRSWSMRVPLDIGAVDGVLIATVVQRRSRTKNATKISKQKSKKKTLRLGVDTGSSLTWGCDAACRVLVERRDLRIRRRKVVVRNTSTRHKTLLLPAAADDRGPTNTNRNSSAKESFRVKFADGTRIRGVFRRTMLSLHGNRSINAPSRQAATAASRFDFDVKIAAALRIQEIAMWEEEGSEGTVPLFESGSVDGYLGLGFASNPKYPAGHAAWDQLCIALNVTGGNEPSIFSVGINVKTPPFAMTITKTTARSPTVPVLARIPISGSRWSAIVHNVRLSKASAHNVPVLYSKARVHFDTGASSIFVPKDALARHDRDMLSENMRLAFQVDTEAANEEYIAIYARGLRVNYTLHVSLVAKNRSSSKVAETNNDDSDDSSSAVDETQQRVVPSANRNTGGPLPQIVLGLPFFQRYRVAFQQESLNEGAEYGTEDHGQRFVTLQL